MAVRCSIRRDVLSLNSETSAERPLLLSAEMDVVAGGIESGQGSVGSPMGSVVSSVSASPHSYPLRSRSRGPYLRDLVEEGDESTFYVSPHARRSLAVQEAWKKVRDEKKMQPL